MFIRFKNKIVLFLSFSDVFPCLSEQKYFFGYLRNLFFFSGYAINSVKHQETLWNNSIIEASNVVDSSGEYIIINNFITREGEYKIEDFHYITLISQCSVNNLFHLLNILDCWDGPVSLSLFLPWKHSRTGLTALSLLHKCSASFRKQVSVHLIFPLTHKKLIQNRQSNNSSTYVCDDLFFALKQIVDFKNYAFNFAYPNNLLRNVGVRTTTTSFVLVIDIDIIPSSNLRSETRELLKTYPPNQHIHNPGEHNPSKIVYVIPTFEIREHMDIPRNKETLLQMWADGETRPFYFEMCNKCQSPTQYERWKRIASSKEQMAYDVEWIDPWEPFYIAPANMPLYDERFKQYGFNRISQVSMLSLSAPS